MLPALYMTDKLIIINVEYSYLTLDGSCFCELNDIETSDLAIWWTVNAEVADRFNDSAVGVQSLYCAACAL